MTITRLSSVQDEPADAHRYQVLASRPAFRGTVIGVRSDEVVMPDGSTAQRDVVEHPGAVAVVAVRGDAGAEEVVLVRQYRHPMKRRLWELPAGLLDVAGEPASGTGARELAEETGLQAQRWDLLLDIVNSPGGSDEAVRIFVARDVSELPDDGAHTGENEEAELAVAWVPLEQAVRLVLDGHITNALAVAGLLAADRARRDGWRLRPADSPWPDRPAHQG